MNWRKVKKAPPSLQWAGGLFDGEGCISLIRYKVRSRWVYKPQMSVVITRPRTALEDFREALGKLGSVQGPYSRQNAGWKDVYCWKCQNAGDIKKCLVLLLPFLRIKRPEAFLMLEYLEIAIDPSKGMRYTDKQMRQRAEFWRKLRDAKREGLEENT